MRNREGSSCPRVSGNLGAETDFLTLFLSDANIPIPQHHKTQASCSRGTNREWGGGSSQLQSLETRTAGQVGEASLTRFLLCPALSWALRLDTFLRVGEAGEKVPRAPDTSW